MDPKYFPPEFKKGQFHCPHCHVYAEQHWAILASKLTAELPNLYLALCGHCRYYSIWQNSFMIFPGNTGIQPPNEDLPQGIIDDYIEAASIVHKSPRGAAALLRLAIQKLSMHLGEKGKSIDSDIASLVKKGLPVKIQQALDFVRVIGNEAVHPGTFDLKDDTETASKLFGLINLIADAMISQPKHIDEMYKTLPPEKLKGIEKRDGKA